MDKKKFLRKANPGDIKGFEDFIDQADSHFLDSKNAQGGKNLGGEFLGHLNHDSKRLKKISTFLTEKVKNIKKFDQGGGLITHQEQINKDLKNQIIDSSSKPDSRFRKNIAEVFDQFFELSKKSN